LEFGSRLSGKAVLFPLSDEHVLFCSQHRAVLQRCYEYVMPDHATMLKLATKDGLQAIARELEIPAPRTLGIGEAMPIEAIATEITYPVILKPTDSSYWHTPQITRLLLTDLLGARAKVVLCRNGAELLHAYRAIAAFDDRLLVQEVIPGEDSRLAYFACYLDRQSVPLGVFAGRKHRVIPVGFGSASYVRSVHDPDLQAVALRLLVSAGYQGLAGVEFKRDSRDECYKLIEVNTRFGMWDGLSVKCGVDLPYIAYRDALRQPVEPQVSYRENVIWIDWQRDARAAILYRRNGQLSLGQWLGSLRGEKMWAIYSRDDWRPGMAFTGLLLQRLWGRVTRQ
jgi:D-aspartate ligase